MSRLSRRLRWQASSPRDGVNLAERGWQWRRFREQARSQSLNRVHQRETGRLSGRLRWQASSHRDGVNLAEMGWQWRRFREQARSHNSGSCTSARYESAVRPPSLASQLPQKSKSKIKRSQPSAAPTVGLGTTSRSGRLSGRHREQAHSYKSKGKAAQLPAAKPPHSTMSASSSAFDLDLPATSEG